MKLWSHLANAHHIDWVLESLRIDSEKWTAARAATRAATLNETWEAAWDEAWAEALNNVRSEAWDMACGMTWNSTYDEACYAAHSAILALVTYDDCDQYLNMSYEQLLIYTVLSERSQAVLLLPLKWMQEHLSESLAITDNT